MKKFWILFGIWAATMVGIAWAHNFVMLRLHPLAYYYTPAGMAINMTVVTIESLIFWPLTQWYGKHVMIPALSKGVEEKKTEIVKECYEACSAAYKDYKEVVIAEFKNDNE